jgi:hypothetical protein
LRTTCAEKANWITSSGSIPGIPSSPAVAVSGGLVPVIVGSFVHPVTVAFAWENESSTVLVVRSVTVPEKLTGMPWSLDETVPTPQATEWSFVVVVTDY